MNSVYIIAGLLVIIGILVVAVFTQYRPPQVQQTTTLQATTSVPTTQTSTPVSTTSTAASSSSSIVTTTQRVNTTPQTPAQPWQMFHGSALHTGLVNVTGPSSGKLKWRFQGGPNGQGSPPTSVAVS